jgi:SAM-dependent methyltransferase
MTQRARIDLNREYDPFARLYNRYWGAEYRAAAAPVVERLLLSRIQPGASVLDVCCGTGQFTAHIRSLGFDIAGIDSSDNMLAFARENAPGIPFTLADVRDFSLNRRFDAAYSVYESLNHVTDMAGLSRAFACIHRHLRSGAPFLFDLNRDEAYILYWNNTDAVVEPARAFITRSAYDDQERIATCDITTFDSTAEGLWRREDFSVRQTCHFMSETHRALLDSGFGGIVLYDARDLGMKGDPGYARTFFLAIA